MKTTVPENLKSDLPLSKWGKILSSTPVVLAVVSTMLAGLASSEMTKAQYDRSLAAQLQSKVGDQWSFFQAKRLRSALQNNTLDLIATNAGYGLVNRESLVAATLGKPGAPDFDSPAGRDAIIVLTERVLPKVAPLPVPDPEIRAALGALESPQPEAELPGLLAAVSDLALENALRQAREHSSAFDRSLKPVSQVVDALEKHIDKPDVPAATRRDFVAARLRFNALRYDAEARLNQGVAGLLELQVRKANLAAERHHRRSQKFFYGMLAAQMGVIVSTLAIAARKRNLLWSLAAIAGAVAVIFATYVFLYV